MAYFEFPHVRNYDADLGWLIRHTGRNIEDIAALQAWEGEHKAEYKILADKVDGLIENLIEPVIPWDSSIAYRIFSIVEYQGSNYIALQNVPVGTMITNTDYWQPAATVIEQINAISVTVSEIKNNIYYVTPEEYGAAGDGEADDSAAMQAAINSGKPVKGIGNYYLASPVTIPDYSHIELFGTVTIGNNTGFIVDCQYTDLYVSHVTGSGTGTAVEIRKTATSGNRVCSHNNIYLCNVTDIETAFNFTAANSSGVQYCTIKFDYIRRCTNGVKINITSSGWVNSNHFIGGRIGEAVVNGIIASVDSGEIDGNYFENIGLEGLTGYGIKLQKATNNNFVSIRFTEAFSGGYKFYFEDCTKNEISGDIFLATDDIYDSVSTIFFPALSYNHFKVHTATEQRSGSFLGREIYSYNRTFYIPGMDNLRQSNLRVDTADVDLTAEGTLIGDIPAVITGGNHNLKLDYFYGILRNGVYLKYYGPFTMTTYNGTSIDTSGFTAGSYYMKHTSDKNMVMAVSNAI